MTNKSIEYFYLSLLRPIIHRHKNLSYNQGGNWSYRDIRKITFVWSDTAASYVYAFIRTLFCSTEKQYSAGMQHNHAKSD